MEPSEWVQIVEAMLIAAVEQAASAEVPREDVENAFSIAMGEYYPRKVSGSIRRKEEG